MKKGILTAILALVIVLCSFLFAGAENTPASVATCYFSALSSGDTAAIKDLSGGEFHHRKQRLLEKNKGYPEFLRYRYAQSDFQVKEVDIRGNSATVLTVTTLADGSVMEVALVMQKDTRGQWKIVDELSN
jgi:hypothetical protein